MSRTILHVDLNNFFASVAMLSHPELEDQPMAVCGDPTKRHGIILSKNQLAKNYGVLTAETLWQAKRKCPGLVTVPPDFVEYNKYSKLAREIYCSYTDLVEPFSIDEAWLDVTGSTHLFGSGETIAAAIRADLKKKLGLTASVGVSFNKIFAKLGSDLKKPDATTIINENNFRQIVWPLPAGDLLFVGKATERKLHSRGIFTIGDIAQRDPRSLTLLLGKWGDSLWQFANGHDEEPVVAYKNRESVKSIGNSTTTPRDLTCENDVKIIFYTLAENIAKRLRSCELKGSVVAITIRDNDLSVIERQAKLTSPTSTSGKIARQAMYLFNSHWHWGKNIRSLGIQVTDLIPADAGTQLSLFDQDKPETEKLEATLDKIRTRFGVESIQRCIMLTDQQLSTFHDKNESAATKEKRPSTLSKDVNR